MIHQSTISNSVSMEGIGLHTGARTGMVLRPAPPGTGIVFRRGVRERVVSIPAVAASVANTRFATVLGHQGLTVSTVEHFLAALAGCRVDNLWVDIDGPEIPARDGSALPFVDLLQKAGTRRQHVPRKYLSIIRPVSVIDEGKRISIVPSRFFRLSFEVEFTHPAITRQKLSVTLSPENFRQEIAPARTFGFLHEVKYLQEQGLAKGGTLENAVVYDEQGIVNPGGLRFPDEVVRHKILDAIGDFSLLGYPLLGHIQARRAGHDMNLRLVKKILSAHDCWKLVEIANEDAHMGSVPASPLVSNFL